MTPILTTEVPIALGLSARMTPYDLWLVKRGQQEPPALTEEWAMAQLLKPVIERLAQAESEASLYPDDTHFVHAEHPWLEARVDLIVAGDRTTCVQLFSAPWSRRAEFDGDLPLDMQAECLAILAVLHERGLTSVKAGVLVGGAEYHQFTVPYDQEACDRLVSQLSEFWAALEGGQPPKPKSLSDLRALFGSDRGTLIQATGQAAEAVQQLRKIKAARDALDEREEVCKMIVQSHMRDAATLVMPDGSVGVTWKSVAPGEYLDQDDLKAEYPEIYQRCLRKKKDSRRFLVKP